VRKAGIYGSRLWIIYPRSQHYAGPGKTLTRTAHPERSPGGVSEGAVGSASLGVGPPVSTTETCCLSPATPFTPAEITAWS